MPQAMKIVKYSKEYCSIQIFYSFYKSTKILDEIIIS